MQNELKTQVEKFRARLKQAPGDASLYRELADLLLEAGKIGAAMNILEGCWESEAAPEVSQDDGEPDPRLARRHFERGLEFADAYLYEQAVVYFIKAMDAGMDNFEVHYCLAGVYKSLDDTGLAMSHCSKAIERNPGFPPAFILLGGLLREGARYSESVQACKKALLLDPDCVTAYYDLACYYSLSNEPDKALAALEMALCKGFADFDWMQRDVDLQSLRQRPEFEFLLKTYRSSAA